MKAPRVAAALALVAIVEIGLFIDAHSQRWQNIVEPLAQPAESRGEGLIIRGNGLGYYAWLRSLLIDGDWDFDNEFDEHEVTGDFVPPKSYRTEQGRRANQWSVGPACIWALAVVPGHYLLSGLGDSSPWSADGYTLPYQLLVGVASLTACLVGLGFLYQICRFYARPARAALAAAFLTLGTTIVHYSAIEVTMAHGLGAVVLAAFVWYWLKSYGSLSLARWFVVGLLLGAACLVRWQLVTFAILPLGEALFLWLRARKTDRQICRPARLAALLVLTAAGAVIAFSPQMLAWKIVYGHWLVDPIPQIAHHWLTPSLWDLFLSQDRSLFYWTPICLLAFLGFFVRWPKLSGDSVRPENQERSALAPPAGKESPAHALGAGLPTPPQPATEGLHESAGRPAVKPSAGSGDPRTAPLERKDHRQDSVGEAAARNEAAALLFAAFGLQAYVLASVWGKGEYLQNVGNYAGVFLSKAYGMRHLTESLVALAPGLAILLERAARRPLRIITGVGFVLALWNLLLIHQYPAGRTLEDGDVEPLTLLTGSVRFVMNEPWLVLVLAEMLGLICAVLLWRNDETAIDADEVKRE
jgi:hypothetical protein